MSDHVELDRHIATWLNEIAPATVDWLKGVISAPLPDGTQLLDCVYSGGEVGRGELPIVVFPMDRTASQLGGQHYPAYGIPGLPTDVAEDERWEDELWDAAAEAVFPWFADRWHEAGGPMSGLAGFICEHDDDRSFDLNARTWIDDSKKWG